MTVQKYVIVSVDQAFQEVDSHTETRRELTSIGQDGYGWSPSVAFGSMSDARRNVARRAVDGQVRHGVGDVLVLATIVVREQRVVGVLLRVPVVQLRRRGALREQLFRGAEVGCDVWRKVGGIKRHCG